MALRVLLADESSTIKKVIQLALSDFAVEVKAVPNGLDVLAVTQSFHPDIIFADILITKKDGYAVCLELKSNPSTSMIPVVLMWSGFMDIDEAKAKGCKANARLEKPFDAEQLRQLVRDLVPQTKTNPVSSFLNFPKMPEFADAPHAASSETHDHQTIEGLNYDDEGPIDDFQPVPLSQHKGHQESHEALNKYKVPLNQTTSAPGNDPIFIELENPSGDENNIPMEEFEEVSFVKPMKPQNPAPNQKAPNQRLESFGQDAFSSNEPLMNTNSSYNPPQFSDSMIVKTTPNVEVSASMVEKVVREEVRAMLEDICWKIIPDIAERVIREEIQKVMQETERSL